MLKGFLALFEFKKSNLPYQNFSAIAKTRTQLIPGTFVVKPFTPPDDRYLLRLTNDFESLVSGRPKKQFET